MKFVLGTAQFGLDYGITNNDGHVSLGEVKKILQRAYAEGIDTIDTAILYGDSESILGEVGVNYLNVITKLPSVPDSSLDAFQWVLQEVKSSLKRLKKDRIEALLLHRPNQLNGPFGDDVIAAVAELKKMGLINKFGISVYSPEDVVRFRYLTQTSIIQGPCNIFDARFQSQEFVDLLEKYGIEFHARSVFLQGLLLQDSRNLPKKFKPWAGVFRSYHTWLQLNSYQPLDACVNYLNHDPFVKKIIVGVLSESQLSQILRFNQYSKMKLPPNFLRGQDMRVIDPSSWGEL